MPWSTFARRIRAAKPRANKYEIRCRHLTTAGYTHVADAHLVEAAEKVGCLIAGAMTRVRMSHKASPPRMTQRREA